MSSTGVNFHYLSFYNYLYKQINKKTSFENLNMKDRNWVLLNTQFLSYFILLRFVKIK
jgi:hypothetical protein